MIWHVYIGDITAFIRKLLETISAKQWGIKATFKKSVALLYTNNKHTKKVIMLQSQCNPSENAYNTLHRNRKRKNPEIHMEPEKTPNN